MIKKNRKAINFRLIPSFYYNKWMLSRGRCMHLVSMHFLYMMYEGKISIWMNQRKIYHDNTVSHLIKHLINGIKQHHHQLECLYNNKT